MDGYYWTLKAAGSKYDPRQPRWPKGTPQGGRWAPEFAGSHLRVTSKENTLARGDDTELYRWSSLGEVVDASRPGRRRTASLDVSDKPYWYFAPPGLTAGRRGWVARTYGRVVLDRGALAKAGWSEDPNLRAEGAWRWLPRNVGFTAPFDDGPMIDAYLGAIRGFEVTNLAEGGSLEQVRDILEFRLGREVPVIETTAAHVTEPFEGQRTFPWDITGS